MALFLHEYLQMLPSSHVSLMDGIPTEASGFLADAFAEFMATSSRLEMSYRELQEEVLGLKEQLAERNAALSASLAQNERMRHECAAGRSAMERAESTQKMRVPLAVENAGIVGRAPALMQALQRARAAASTDADVLVEAESGAGKELLAKFIHETSARASRPFVAVNCAAVPEHLMESELFGHAKGAFTGASAAKAGKFELAHGGTILLDEMGEMPLHLQPKLLRVLQEREFERLGETRTVKVNVRVIATTNASLGAMVEAGKFREDLYYRLNVIPLSIPALRDRAEDIPMLAKHFAERFGRESGCGTPVLGADFLERLRGHSWPGNVRELGNFMRRVLSLHPGERLDAACFDREFRPLRPQAEVCVMPVAGTRIAVLEKLHLENTLALAQGNRTHAAEMLGISLRTVRNKIKEYGLPPRRYA